MNRYRVNITDGPGINRDVEIDADTAGDARMQAKADWPDARIGTAFRIGAMSEVPKRRSGNSRYSMKDTGGMPDVDPGLASNRKGRRG